MSAALNNSIKYSFTIRAPTQILYEFRIREALDLLRIEDSEVTAFTTVTAYSIIIRKAVRNNSKIVILAVRST